MFRIAAGRHLSDRHQRETRMEAAGAPQAYLRGTAGSVPDHHSAAVGTFFLLFLLVEALTFNL